MCLIYSIIIVSVLYFFFHEDIRYYIRGEKFETKIFSSPKKEKHLTLMLHTEGIFNYYSYIYIIPGINKYDELPEKIYGLKFPDGTGVYIEWKKEDTVDIYTCSKPELNNYHDKDYTINIHVNRNYIDELIEKGENVVRYEIK